MRVQLFIPCFIDQLYPQTAFNMVKVLEKAACDVHYNTNQTCCGQPAYNAGFAADSKAVALKFLKDFEGADYIVAPSASCVGFVRNYYPALFDNTASHNEVKNIGNRIFEFTEFLIKILKIENFGASLPVKATYHDSCAGLRECKIKEEPRRLLNQVQGLELLEMEDNETCCGFGGTFAVKFDPISIAMAEQKIGHAMDTGATHLISTDHSCLMHIDGVIKNKKLSLECMHIADVLASGW
ncbi:MAG: Fe-S oxidoreductase [Niastella sp. SCN 39-18]|nr:(Fe-S)-binding protein [Sphingobacteriales bacterium]ODT53799.1 MAG: Fe-S oxidoreductase [Niastella sp. SCN 39-18]OJW07635.1 MAG: Fe-S oxidoreductase [Sphingobacteriales bacterium 39-19]